ncbi:MAG: SAM-dependent methyltransferase [Myxococcaceae bacterium]|nr:SAM-dependent methyltransferase [Myxococcaceae bacterium]
MARRGPHGGARVQRLIHAGDGVAWLEEHSPLPADHSIITSLPDSSEVPALGFEGWRTWFSETSRLICDAVAPSAAAIFFQTDVKREGTWVDKAYLVQRGAEAAGTALLWHKVVCRAPAGMTTFGRPAYAHLLCFSRGLRLEKGQSTADVMPRLGEMTWARAMGVEACVASVKFLAAHARARVIVDPFCGLGTAVAVANQLGLGGIGVELSAKRAEKARSLTVRLT